MIAPPALPSLPGLAWSRHKKPGFSTRVASHVSGREVRVALMSSPLYEFEAVYSGLASSSAAAFAGLGSTSLQSLMGFFLQLLGQAGTFLYTDPDDGSVAGQFVAVGDGVTQSFILSRTLGGFNEPVAWVSNVANVYLNGVAQPSNSWIFTAPNSIGFYTAPASSVAVTADFSYAFQCRFLDDQMDFEEFMSSLWKLDSMKFRSIKANIAAAPAPAWYSRYAIGGVLPALFADTATEASADHYYYNGSTYSGFAALLAACGMTFSRASSATYTNSSGQVATAGAGTLRFDYSSGGAPLGILLEGASTNLQNYSSGNFAVGGFWTGTANYTITDNAVTGPDGLTSASSVYPNSTSSASFYQFGAATIAYASGTTYTHAWYFKYAGNRYIQLWANENVSLAYANFDLQAGTLGSYANVVSTPLIQPLGSGWYRCVMTVSANQNGLNGAGYGLVGSSSATRLQAFAPGSTSNGIYVFGAQVEALPFASSYIPTTTGSATRAADVFTAAAWPALATGTLYVKADTAYSGRIQRLLQVDDGTANNRASLSFNQSAATAFDFLNGGTSEAALTAGTIAAGTQIQVAAAFAANDFALVEAGGTPATASSGGIPVLSKLRIGADTSAANNLFGHIAQFGIWNGLRAPNTMLQSLT